MEQIFWIFSGIVVGVLLTGLLGKWFFKPASPSQSSITLTQVKARHFPSFRQTPEQLVALVEMEKTRSHTLWPLDILT